MNKTQSFIFTAVVIAAVSVVSSGIAKADNAYVSNNANDTIELISGGVTSTLITSDLSGPTGVAVYGNNLFVANNASTGFTGYVAEFTLSGTFEGVVEGGLQAPRGITFDTAGNMYVANQNNGWITEVPTGGGLPKALATGLGWVNGLTSDSSNNLYVTDAEGTIQKIGTSNGIATSTTTLVSGLNNPVGITYYAGNLYVVDNADNSISEFNATTGAAVVNPFITALDAQTGLDGIAVDSTGKFFVTDGVTNTVTEYDSKGNVIEVFTSGFDGACFDATALAVPEPSTYLLSLAGMGALFFFLHRRRQTVRI